MSAGGAGRVVVVGSFMMDLTVRAVRRPRPGETVVGSSFEEFLGGKGCNQAIAAARAGASTTMVGRVGDDPYGHRFLDRLRREAIDATHVRVDGELGTGIGLPLVEAGGENSIVIVPRANDATGIGDVEAAAPTIAGADVLLLQLELPVATIVAAARCARAAGRRVVLNPAPAVADLAAFAGLVDVLVPNEGEAAALTGLADPGAAAEALRRQLGCSVVVTLGPQGSLVLEVGADGPEQVPAHTVTALDTVGAGDAYCGSLGARLAAGDDLLTAARFASAAAALSVTVAGAEPSIPRAADVEALLASGSVHASS